jgi:hypothetical protein
MRIRNLETSPECCGERAGRYMATRVPITGLRGAVFLHRCLVGGLLSMSAIIAILAFRHIAPLSAKDETALLIGKILAGVSVCLVAAGLLIFRPRMPEYQGSHAHETYWDSPASVAAANRIWFFLEGAAITSLVGFLLSGHPAPAFTAAVAIAALILSGPGRLARS